MKLSFKFSLFNDNWKPKYKTGDMVYILPNELAKYTNVTLLTGHVLDHDKNTPKKYYKIITSNLLDHNNKPMVLFVHEETIVKKITDKPTHIPIEKLKP